jgi:hypothetical protein
MVGLIPVGEFAPEDLTLRNLVVSNLAVSDLMHGLHTWRAYLLANLAITLKSVLEIIPNPFFKFL